MITLSCNDSASKLDPTPGTRLPGAVYRWSPPLFPPFVLLTLTLHLECGFGVLCAGGLWASCIAGSILINFRKPGEKFSVKLIHAR